MTLMGLVAWDLGAENLPSPPGFKDHTPLTESSAGISSPLVLIFLFLTYNEMIIISI
jgi:hypothetical protein